MSDNSKFVIAITAGAVLLLSFVMLVLNAGSEENCALTVPGGCPLRLQNTGGMYFHCIEKHIQTCEKTRSEWEGWQSTGEIDWDAETLANAPRTHCVFKQVEGNWTRECWHGIDPWEVPE